ncbi:MAG: cysteine--tRNA ligase [Nanoarchaeota archaeon]|nr:cysteine--tRNA ligase [Nanoarchaeota archaeon]MBU4116887.1 cysteine--tRNA ligase [Nanoarchaeota archaeon]
MELKLYNTLTRKKEVFKPIKKGEAGVYVCGPTIYNYIHIGNLRAYLIADILRRVLKFNNYKIKEVMNLTDVDDKTIRDSQKQNKSLKEFTAIYEKGFLEDIKLMNLEMPEVMPKATEHINEMVEIIKQLLDKKIAYKTDNGIYFSIKKFKDYGKLSNINLKKLKTGASERVLKDEYDKENINDFAIWKFYSKEDGNVFWNTEIGKGRPGWHIECSAMSMKYLGKHFDIHTGGEDLIFPHHENEIAQSECATGKKFVNYWLHNGWVLVDNRKMSKSLGNFYNLRDIIKKEYSPLDLRYFYLTKNYRQRFNFTWENLKASKIAYNRLKNIISEIKDNERHSAYPKLRNAGANKPYLKEFEKAINNDLDTPKALQVLWKLVRDKNAKGKLNTIEKIDEVFGLKLLEKSEIKIPIKIKELIKGRENARKNKDWKKADNLRDEIKKLGYIIDDAKNGVRVKRG